MYNTIFINNMMQLNEYQCSHRTRKDYQLVVFITKEAYGIYVGLVRVRILSFYHIRKYEDFISWLALVIEVDSVLVGIISILYL